MSEPEVLQRTSAVGRLNAATASCATTFRWWRLRGNCEQPLTPQRKRGLSMGVRGRTWVYRGVQRRSHAMSSTSLHCLVEDRRSRRSA